MTAQLLAGGPVAEVVLQDVRSRVQTLQNSGITPGLGTILLREVGMTVLRSC